jgi:hypothetical protein
MMTTATTIKDIMEKITTRNTTTTSIIKIELLEKTAAFGSPMYFATLELNVSIGGQLSAGYHRCRHHQQWGFQRALNGR